MPAENQPTQSTATPANTPASTPGDVLRSQVESAVANSQPGSQGAASSPASQAGTPPGGTASGQTDPSATGGSPAAEGAVTPNPAATAASNQNSPGADPGSVSGGDQQEQAPSTLMEVLSRAGFSEVTEENALARLNDFLGKQTRQSNQMEALQRAYQAQAQMIERLTNQIEGRQSGQQQPQQQPQQTQQQSLPAITDEMMQYYDAETDSIRADAPADVRSTFTEFQKFRNTLRTNPTEFFTKGMMAAMGQQQVQQMIQQMIQPVLDHHLQHRQVQSEVDRMFSEMESTIAQIDPYSNQPVFDQSSGGLVFNEAGRKLYQQAAAELQYYGIGTDNEDAVVRAMHRIFKSNQAQRQQPAPQQPAPQQPQQPQQLMTAEQIRQQNQQAIVRQNSLMGKLDPGNQVSGQTTQGTGATGTQPPRLVSDHHQLVSDAFAALS